MRRLMETLTGNKRIKITKMDNINKDDIITK